MLKERGGPLSAQTLAAKGLSFLAEDPERLGRFLALSGLDPSTIRAAARGKGFLPAVLDHLLADERLLLAFAERENIPPETIARVRGELGGHAADGHIPD